MSPRMKVAFLTASALAGFLQTRDAAAQQDQASASATSGLEEIVVTARRREERVQAVPIAITAFSQADLERQQIHDVHDLGNHVPSLNVSLPQSDANGLYAGQVRLRGLPGMEIYVADVPIGNADYQAGTGIQHGLSEGNFFDLDDIEVVKGPQGTLFGKNSVGGLISIRPKKPTNNYEGYAKVAFGNYADKEGEFALNIPVIRDTLLVRIAGQGQQRDGYTHNVFSGKDLDNKNYQAWRASITLRPSDDFENYFMTDGYWQDTNGGANIVKYLNPNFILSRLGPGFVPLDPGVTKGCVAVVTLQGPAFGPLPPNFPGGCGQFQIGLYQQDLNIPFQEQQRLGPRAVVGDAFQGIGKDYFYGFTDTITWEVADNLTIKNIAAARIYKQLATDNFTPFGVQILNIGVPGNNQIWSGNSAQYTEELQFQGRSLGGKLEWVVGGYLEYDHPIGDTLLGSANLLGTSAGAVSYYHFNNQSRSQALFVHGIYDLSDILEGLRITGGYRYTWDYAESQSRSATGVDAVIRDAAGNPTNCPAIFGADRNCYQSLSAHFSSPGWNVSLDEQLDPNTLLYVRAGNAYRPGGFNLAVPAAFATFGPEHVTDVEIGAKVDWELFGMHLRTNGDIFRTTYKAIQITQQVSTTDSNGINHTNTLNQNAASATIQGGELEGVVVPFDGLELEPHISYLNAGYDQYPTVFGNEAGANPAFLFSPKWAYGVTVTYHLPIDQSVGDVALSANYSWTGHQYDSTSIGEIFPIIPSFDLLNIKVDWTNVLGHSFDVGFFMTNALDKLYVQGVEPIYDQLGFTSVVYGQPRMFGFSLKYRFSEGDEEATTTAPYAPPPAVAVAPPIPKSYLVFFDFNRSDLTAQAAGIVDEAAKNAGAAKVTRLTVTGHTDTVGSDAYNMRLSRRRAESVAMRLQKNGVPASEIGIVAKGKRDLLIPTGDGVREPQNRRVQILYEDQPGS